MIPSGKLITEVTEPCQQEMLASNSNDYHKFNKMSAFIISSITVIVCMRQLQLHSTTAVPNNSYFKISEKNNTQGSVINRLAVSMGGNWSLFPKTFSYLSYSFKSLEYKS